MNFSSAEFLVFFLLTALVYYLVPQKGKNVILLGASYLFYMFLVPSQALFLFTLTGIAYITARLIERNFKRRKIFLTISLCVGFGLLFLLKYFNFAASLVADLMTFMGVNKAPIRLDILLPMGISFYIFQLSGYMIDVYQGKVKAERNFIIFALFASFFPQIASGPIGRAAALIPQFREKRTFKAENIYHGVLLFLWGLFKKLIIADNLAVIINAVYANPADFSYKWLIVATVAFSIQIYCDFSAYTDMARGTARMLGFNLAENFRQPYLAVSIENFWRRWHISLSTWFRDYIYSAWRQPKRADAKICECHDCIFGKRPLAWCVTDLCGVGRAERLLSDTGWDYRTNQKTCACAENCFYRSDIFADYLCMDIFQSRFNSEGDTNRDQNRNPRRRRDRCRTRNVRFIAGKYCAVPCKCPNTDRNRNFVVLYEYFGKNQ